MSKRSDHPFAAPSGRKCLPQHSQVKGPSFGFRVPITLSTCSTVEARASFKSRRDTSSISGDPGKDFSISFNSTRRSTASNMVRNLLLLSSSVLLLFYSILYQFILLIVAYSPEGYVPSRHSRIYRAWDDDPTALRILESPTSFSRPPRETVPRRTP